MSSQITAGERGVDLKGRPPSPDSDRADDLRRTARVTGIWYLALAVTGMVGFLVIRPEIYVAGDPVATAANLVDRAGLARLGLLFELALVTTQALAAVWFYKLFRSLNNAAAFALAAFGLVNAVAIMASAVFMATSLSVAGGAGLAPGGDVAATVQLMYQLSTDSWGVGSLFFGLWLVPMGHIAASTGRYPIWLGRLLIVGGGGYILGALISYGIAGAPAWLVDLLPIPATIAELWIIAYLLFVGIRESPRGEAPSRNLR